MPARKITTQKVPVLGFRAEIKDGSINVDKRTVELIFATGAPVRRGGWFTEPFNEELSLDPAHVKLDRLRSGGPLLNSHSNWDLSSILGVVERADADGKQGTATVRFPKAEDDPEADQIFRKVADKIIRNVSVGYKVNKYEEVGDSKTAKKNGQIPTFRAIDWEPMEISLVPIPADWKSQVRADGSPDPEAMKNVRMFDCEFIRLADTEDQPEVVPANDGGKTGAAKTTPETATRGATQMDPIELKRIQDEAAAAALLAEQTRSNEIMSSVTEAGLDLAFARSLIDGKKTVLEARGLIIAEMAKRSKAASEVNATVASATMTATVTEDETDKWRKGTSDWLVQRSGASVSAAVEGHTKAKLDGGNFRGMSLMDIARDFLERSGVKTRGMDKMDMVGKALTHRSGYNTTSDFAVLLENTLHKILLASYALTPDSWTKFCARGTVSDFRAHNRYRQGTFGSLDTVPEHSEFKNKQIPDGTKESITAATKGNIIALSRQAIINDDMGSFNSLAMRLGRAAKLSVEVDVFALLGLNSGLGPNMNDGKALFHTDHANINAAGSALGVAGLDADRVVMASQRDPSGNEILDLRPSILVLPIGLGGAARVFNNSQYDAEVSSKFQVPNKVLGLFQEIVDSPRISGTRRYLFASPSIAPTIEVAFLDGQENPFLESKDGFRIDGVEWKVRLDYGVAGIDYRGAVTNAGA